MQALLNGNLSFIVYLFFPILLFSGLFMQRIVGNIRRELDMAKYELERGPIEEAPQPPPKEMLLPGYTMLTQEDYDELDAKVRSELKESDVEAQ